MKLVLCWLLLASLAAVGLTVYDKYAAKQKKRRIPEKHLLLWAVAGGAAAELLVMLLIRHKTRHKKFMLGLPAILLLQALIAWGISSGKLSC